MKSRGAKAILQIGHAGREAAIPAQQGIPVLVPTKMDFPWINYPIEEMTNDDVNQLITDWGKATQRAIDAGFDGVEIHNCNHDLVQQFFSAFSNHRTDQWGGSFEKRCALPLAILKETHRVIAASDKPDFIVGWRISPDEIHGENVGFTVDDMLKQTKLVLNEGIDYLNISLTGSMYSYKNPRRTVMTRLTHSYSTLSCRIVYRYILDHRSRHLQTLKMLLTVADGVYMAREALSDQDTDKLKSGHADVIGPPPCLKTG